MFKKNQKVMVTTGPASTRIGKIRSYDKNHPSGLPWFVQSDKNAKESEIVIGRFKTDELAPIVRKSGPGVPVDKSVGKE